MKIQDENGRVIPYSGLSRESIATLVALVDRHLERKDHVLICIAGNKGVGKSTLGKFFRKTGLGTIRPRDIAVIDDDCMSVDVLHFFRRKYVNPCRGIDELAPFLRYCRRKKVRFYVKSDPESRITRADVLLNVTITDKKRKERLIRRYGKTKGERVFERTRSYACHPKIECQHQLTAELP
jgi:hypothetical protein